MISALRVCVQLQWAVQYIENGTQKLVPAATGFEWLDVDGVYGVLDLIPGQQYATAPGSGFECFIWAGPCIKSFREDDPSLEIAVLQHGSMHFLVPLTVLTRNNGTDWDRRIAILAWETIQSLRSYHEVTRYITSNE